MKLDDFAVTWAIVLVLIALIANGCAVTTECADFRAGICAQRCALGAK